MKLINHSKTTEKSSLFFFIVQTLTRFSLSLSFSDTKMTRREASESIIEIVCSAFLESCCKVVIIPLCEDNIRRLSDRLKSEQERIMRSTDLSKKEGFIWTKKLVNLKKRSEFFLATHESRSRAGLCCFLCFPFDNYIAATLLQNWEKLDEEDPSATLPPDSTNYHQLSRKSTAPIGAIEDELSNGNGIVVRSEDDGRNKGKGDMNYTSNNILVLNSLSFRGESDQVPRDLLSTFRMVAGPTETASVKSTHGSRHVRSRSFEMIRDERRIVHHTRFCE